MLPISAVGTDNEENIRQKYEEDIRNVVLKRVATTDASRLTPEMPEELTELPFGMTELTTAGCYYSLVCLYDYLGTHSNITLTLAYRNTAARRHLLRGVIDELRRTDLVSEEVQKAASCVSLHN
jgi:hypothetical protein